MTSSAGPQDDVLPLDGIRVVEVSTSLGAYCGRLLADLGADVVKVEMPSGDRLRYRPPFAYGRADPDTSLNFAYYHANKRSVVVDYQDRSCVGQLASLAKEADVLLLTPTPDHQLAGVDVAAMTVGWARPDAIVCFITPFGLTGPYRSWRSTHLTSAALSGLMYQQGPVEGPPVVIPGEQYYNHTGTHAAVAVVAALRERHRLGGQSLDISAHEVLTQSYNDLYIYTSADDVSRRRPEVTNSSVGVWLCADGPVQVVASTDKHWFALVDLLGSPPELADPAWSHPIVRFPHEERIAKVMTPIIASMKREDFVSKGQELGLPCALVNTVGEFTDDPQPTGRGFFVSQFAPGIGKILCPGTPFLTSRPLARPYRRPAPALGEAQVDEVTRRWASDRSFSRRPGPLSNVRILSFGTAYSGALAATALAELGADVVKIESPNRPDNTRRLSRPAALVVQEPSGAVTSPMFASLNRSVRSVAVDMKEPGAVELVLRLTERCDVVIENFAPGVMARWGLTYEAMAAANAGLVVLSLTGFGQAPGPRTHYLAYGSTVASFVGLARAWGYSSATHFDYVAQAHGVLAVLAALAGRDATGSGMHIDLSEVEAAAAVMGPLVLDYTVNGDDAVPIGNQVPGSAFSEVVRCLGHDAWLAVEIEEHDDLPRLFAVLGLPEPPPGEEPSRALREALCRWAAPLTPHEAMRKLQRAGVAAGAVQTSEDVYRDPQHWARGMFVEMDHPDMGLLALSGPPHRMSKTPAEVHGRTPRLGEHTVQILAEWGDMVAEEAERWAWP
jgi:crotonobetainyl-CoA:carnitine CoA-transferase CaiB-like acyl-CoA transferase